MHCNSCTTGSFRSALRFCALYVLRVLLHFAVTLLNNWRTLGVKGWTEEKIEKTIFHRIGYCKLSPDKLFRKFLMCTAEVCPITETPSASFPFVFFSSFLYSFSLCVHVSLSSLTIFLSVSRFLFLSRVQYLFSSGIFNRCQLASDTYCCFQQTQTFFLRLTFLKWLFAVVQYIAKVFLSQQILCIRNGFEVSILL